ncbi:hypothetical protein HDK77DRAFT_449836 [Phyllosticta capitalensis]
MRLITLIRLIKLIIKRNDKSNKDEDDDESSDSDDDDAELQTRRCKLLAGWPLDLCPGPGLDLLLTKGKKKAAASPCPRQIAEIQNQFHCRLFAIFLYRIHHPWPQQPNSISKSSSLCHLSISYIPPLTSWQPLLHFGQNRSRVHGTSTPVEDIQSSTRTFLRTQWPATPASTFLLDRLLGTASFELAAKLPEIHIMSNSNRTSSWTQISWPHLPPLSEIEGH